MVTGADRIAELEQQLEDFKAFYYQRRGQWEQLKQEKESLERERQEVAAAAERIDEARLLLQEVAAYAREQGRAQVEALVTQALQFVFGEHLEFKVALQEKRDRTEAVLLVASEYPGGRVVQEPEASRGGGVVDVVSLALRIALLEASDPPLAGSFVLDEPAKHVSAEYSPNVAQFLKGVSQSFGRQIIMVTHDQYLAEVGDASFLVAMRDGASHVTQVG